MNLQFLLALLLAWPRRTYGAQAVPGSSKIKIGCNELNEPELSLKTSTAYVSCCSQDGSSGARDSAPLGGLCSGLLTYDQAEAFCANGGYRLCDEHELAVACGTGCGYDPRAVWVRDDQEGVTSTLLQTDNDKPPPPPRMNPILIIGIVVVIVIVLVVAGFLFIRSKNTQGNNTVHPNKGEKSTGGKEFSAFFSYRVHPDQPLVDSLYLHLNLEIMRMLEKGKVMPKAFMDKHCLLDGRDWEAEFVRALRASALFVPFITNNVVNSLSDEGRVDRQDNVLLEWHLARYLHLAGIIKYIYPIMSGGYDPNTRMHIAFDFSAIKHVNHVPSKATLAEMKKHLDGIATEDELAELKVDEWSAKSTVEYLLHQQGLKLAFHGQAFLAAAVDKIVDIWESTK